MSNKKIKVSKSLLNYIAFNNFYKYTHIYNILNIFKQYILIFYQLKFEISTS